MHTLGTGHESRAGPCSSWLQAFPIPRSLTTGVKPWKNTTEDWEYFTLQHNLLNYITLQLQNTNHTGSSIQAINNTACSLSGIISTPINKLRTLAPHRHKVACKITKIKSQTWNQKKIFFCENTVWTFFPHSYQSDFLLILKCTQIRFYKFNFMKFQINYMGQKETALWCG